jgi:hypothetical protein
MRRLLLTAASMTAMTGALAAIPAEVTIKAQILGDAVVTESQTVPASATLAFYDSAYQQLLQGGANP